MADTINPVAPATEQVPPGQNSTDVGAQTPTQEETNDFSSKFAHLARKEKALRAEQRKLQAERDAWKAQRDASESQLALLSRIEKDPLGVLAEKGITEEQLTSLLVNKSNPQEANILFQLQQENKELRAKLDKIDQRFEENDKQSYEQAVNQIKNDAKVLIKSNVSDFEMVNAAGEDGIEAIAELCKLTWQEDQILISVQDAAEMVEQELLENAITLASANKVKAKLQPAPNQEPTKQQTTFGKRQPTTTLNSQSAQATSKPMSARERAIAAFKGQL